MTIAVFGSSTLSPGADGWDGTVRLGRRIAERGWRVATGGYGGAMEAVSAGAAAVGGMVVGVTAPSVFPHRPGANPHVGEELQETTIGGRIARLVEMADGVIALPGSIGTLAELVVAWNVAFLAPDGLPVVAVGPVWAEIVATVGSRLPTGGGLVSTVRTTDQAFDAIEQMITGTPPTLR